MVLFNTLAFGVANPKIVLSHGVPLPRGLPKPIDRLNIVLPEATTRGVTEGEEHLGFSHP